MNSERRNTNVDLYKILGVSRTSSQSEIKKAYKLLAVRYHPDKNPDGVETFKEIVHAYRSLSDPEIRNLYDTDKKKFTLHDLHVELTQKELKEFVDDLVRTDLEDAEKRKAFEKRKEEELARRAAFEAAHPNYKPSSHVVDHETSIHEIRKAFLESLSSSQFCQQPQKADKRPPTPRQDELRLYELQEKYNNLFGGNLGSTYKQHLLNSFRTKISTGDPELCQTFTKDGIASSSFPKGPDGLPIPDTEIIRQTYGRFNYKDYVIQHSTDPTKTDKERLRDAILSDALKEYDFSSSISSVDES